MSENEKTIMAKLNIYQRLSAITTSLTKVAKNLSVGVGSNSYKAVGEADVLAAVKPLEAEYGVYSYPFSREVIKEETVVKTTTYKEQTTEKREYVMRVKTVYRFVNMDKPDEFVDITTYGDGIDSNDKAPGKAMTYGDKYALLKAYKIETGDDPDQEPSDKGDKSYGRKVDAKPPKTYKCDVCGKEMDGSLFKKTKEAYGFACCCKECKEQRLSEQGEN